MIVIYHVYTVLHGLVVHDEDTLCDWFPERSTKKRR